ncbi:type VII secretion protein EccE [Streptacidiphilus sp. PB12-B1b]|uniref:type VII secretion protein EccE n=1 Tax=Streptacidiphilus sp. PB12-B1b TaxID=2705012 RepID=UPI0015F81291|nr:type VII secretion protein EccE [Streptacidiphilus sp. PB12-B1b]QMU78798.1 type VII secretion protein EccE [Streptacidiphilus sp. PB12-B1b]
MPKQAAALRPPRPGGAPHPQPPGRAAAGPDAAGPARAHTPARPSAPAPVTVAARPRPGRLGPLRLPQVVLVELAAALVLIGLAGDRIALAVCGVAAAVLVVVAVVRLRGLSLAEQVRVRAAFRERRQRSAANPPDPQADPALTPVLECEPALRTVQHTLDTDGGHASARGERREIGMVGDGTFLTAVLQVEARDTPLRPARALGLLPLDLLGAGLRVDDIVLDAIQVVQYTQPAPAPHLPEQSLAARGYRELPAGASTPGLRLTWVTVRLDPELCRSAVAARGGGEQGARKALQRAADQLAGRLDGAGLRATVLDAAGAVAAVATATCANPLATGGTGRPGRRTAETVRAWRCDDRWHTTYWISQWPRLTPDAGPAAAGGRGSSGPVAAPDLIGLLTGTTALGSTFSLTLRQAMGGAVALTGHVRVTARGQDELEQSARQLETRARSAGAALVRLDREQVPGLLATLPLGGTR